MRMNLVAAAMAWGLKQSKKLQPYTDGKCILRKEKERDLSALLGLGLTKQYDYDMVMKDKADCNKNIYKWIC